MPIVNFLQLSQNELMAIQNASLVNTDTVAKTSDIPAPQLTSNEVTAINNASLAGTDTVAKTSDIPTPQLSAGELTAIQNASLVNTDTVAKTSDIPAPQLSAGELTAIQNASLVNTDTVAKTSDIPAPQLTSNEVTSINNASLGASDTVAKVSDIYYQPNIEVPLSRMRVSEYVWAYTANPLYLENAVYSPSNPRNGLEFFYDFECPSGIYELNAICPTNGDLGRLNVYVDDVYQGYIDTYTSALYYNVSFSVFFNITSSGAHTIKFIITKNTSSSDYKVYFAKMVLRKIHVGWVFYWSHGKYSNHKVMNSTIIAGALQRNPEASMKPFQEYWLQNSPAINDEFHSPDMYLPDGTYELGMTILKNTNEGILSVYENDTLIDTYDFYAAAPEFNVIPTFSVTIDEARATKFKFKVLSKNASSSNYYIAISNLYLKRTA